MARPPEVTDAEIIAAGRTIEAAGKPVTPYSLRVELGRGSPTRLHNVWTAHEAAAAKAAAGQARTAPQPPVLPASVRDELARLTNSLSDGIEGVVRRIAADLSAQAAAGTQAERDLLARERDRLAAADREALEAYSALAEEVDRLRAENEALQEQVHHARVARDAADLLRQHEADRCAVADAARVEALADAARAGERALIAERRIAELDSELAALRRVEQARQSEATMPDRPLDPDGGPPDGSSILATAGARTVINVRAPGNRPSGRRRQMREPEPAAASPTDSAEGEALIAVAGAPPAALAAEAVP